MANSSYDVTQFRNLINEIKQYLNNRSNISEQDRKIIGDLMQVLRYEVEFEILEECINNSDILTTIIADIDTKLIELEKNRAAVIAKDEESWSKNTELISIGMSKTRLVKIKDCIKEKNFSYYIEAMNRSLTSADALIAICQEVLSSGIEDFNNLFGSSLVDNNEIGIDAVNIVFAILHNYELRSELESYIKRENKSSEFYDEIANNEKYMEYLKLAKENEDLLREYIAIRTQTGELGNSQIAKCKDKISRATLELDNIPETGLVAIIHNRRKNELVLSIEENRNKLKLLLEKRNRRLEIEEELSILGLGPVIECYGQVFDGRRLTTEQKVAEFIKISMQKNSFDVESAKIKLQNQNMELGNKAKMAENTMVNYKNSLSYHARELVEKYHDDVKKVLTMLEEKKNGKVTPILATYVLKALVTARGFSYQEINEICDLKQGAEKLITSYENMVGRTSRNIQESLKEIETRDAYDLSEFGPMKL